MSDTQYFNNNRYYMDGSGFHITKVFNATETRTNSLSFSLVFSSAYFSGGVEINTFNSIRMMNDGATSWLSFVNTDHDETALLSLRTDKSFWLLSRNEANVDGPCLGCSSNINDNRKIVRYVKHFSDGVFQDMAGVYGDGTSYDHAKHSLEVKADPTIVSSNQTDGDFDHWDYDELTGWTFFSMEGGLDSECQTVHDDGVHTPYSGTYSLQLGSKRLGKEDEVISIAASSITTLTAEDNAVVSVYAKYEETQTEGNIGFIFATALGDGAQFWNNTTHTWEVPAELGADHIDTHAVTDTWTKYTHSDSANFEAPTGNNFFIAIVGSTISEKVLIDEVECLKDGVGDNHVVNGGFETVDEDSAFPTFYDDISDLKGEEELDANIYRETSIVHSGNNAVKINYEKRILLFQLKEGTPGDYVQHTHYARKVNNEDISQSCYGVIQLDEEGDFGGMYDWSKCEFVAKADMDNPNLYPYMYLRPMTTGYTQFKSPPFPIPESGSYIVLFGGYTDEEVYGNIYIDTARNNLVTLDSNRTIYQITNDTEIMNLLPDDAVFSIDAKDNGEDFNLFKIDGRGKFKTDFDRLDFSDEIVKVDEATEETSPVPLSQLKELTPHYLGHADVDWTVEGAIKICDIADDEKLVITGITIITNLADTITEQPIFSLGNNAFGDYKGIYDTVTLPSDINNPKAFLYNWTPSYSHTRYIQNGDPIYINVKTAAVATAFTGRVILHGFSTDIAFGE